MYQWWREIEENFHPHRAESSPLRISTMDFKENYQLPIITVTLYVVGIAYGHKWMKDREAFNLRNALAAWNLFLSIFSAMGAYRTVPVLLSKLFSYPLRRSVCTAAALDWGAGPCGLWVQLFIVSKFAELADTAFIVLRKRKLLFLHWFHHWSVLLYCYHAYATEAPHALFFVAMNYTVHTIMYFYYALMAAHMKPYWIPPEIVTAAQIGQMIVGVTVQLAALRERLLHSKDCVLADGTNIVFGCLMYAMYLGLFLKFALDRYLFQKFPRGKLFQIVSGHEKSASVRTAFPIFFFFVDSLDWLIRKYNDTKRKTSKIITKVTSNSQLNA